MNPCRPFVLLLLLSPCLASADSGNKPDSPATREKAVQLEQIKARILTLQNELQQTRNEHTRETRELRRTELAISKIRRQVHQTDRKLGQTRYRLRKLNTRQGQLDEELEQHIEQLEQQVRSAYIVGRQPVMKLLLNQSRPETISRVLAYNQYLGQARRQEINSVSQRLSRLRQTETEIRQHQQQLGTLKSERLGKQASLSEARTERKRVLASLKKEIVGQDQQLKRLKRDEARLESLLQDLTGIFADLPAALGEQARFSTMRNKLRLPVPGAPSSLYGGKRGPGQISRKGVFIPARTGGPVAAAFRGRVAFADWLRGFGLLMILEHGDGYMTLYGHNESLYKEVGDWVETNEIIAASGNTGNPPTPGLYFEIRHNGQPKNPMHWCRVRRNRAG